MSSGQPQAPRAQPPDDGAARRRWRWRVNHTWEGTALTAEQTSVVSLECRGGIAEITVDAPYLGDPAPSSPKGRCDGLWNHEVVELFVCGGEQRYLEVECGPHGHFLVLQFYGARKLARDDVPVTRYVASIGGARWRGVLALEQRWLPPGMKSANAYRIAGQGGARAYAAAYPGDGAPDFHRLDLFRPLAAATATD